VPTPRSRSERKADTSLRGERLLSAVERLVEDGGDLVAHVETLKSAASPTLSDDDRLDVLAERIIADYSRRSAVAGGVTSLPALLPGGGSALALVGGVLIDMTYLLKHDVEMILCLSYLYGHDIRQEKERWLAYVLAGIRTYDVEEGRNYLADLLEVQLDALPKYTPRELFKLAATVLGKVALLSFSRGFVKALPLIGIAVSASTNQFMTSSTGWWCVEALKRRREAERNEGPEAVDAFVR
jgi:uncharacterized protein (DUF697 family)